MSAGALVTDIASWILIVIGSLSLLTGAIGVLRMPDVYTRMHAASITDTMGAGALMIGMMIQAGFTLIAVKLLMILVFIFFTSPTSTFSLAHAALTSGVEPVLHRGGNAGEAKDKEDAS
jgi:multicomponent Na+:H+ antiporter subunit G